MLDEPCRLYLTGIHYNQEEYTYTLLQSIFVCSDCSSSKMIHAMVMRIPSDPNTEDLSQEQLKSTENDVGAGRSLPVLCSSFRGDSTSDDSTGGSTYVRSPPSWNGGSV